MPFFTQERIAAVGIASRCFFQRVDRMQQDAYEVLACAEYHRFDGDSGHFHLELASKQRSTRNRGHVRHVDTWTLPPDEAAALVALAHADGFFDAHGNCRTIRTVPTLTLPRAPPAPPAPPTPRPKGLAWDPNSSEEEEEEKEEKEEEEKEKEKEAKGGESVVLKAKVAPAIEELEAEVENVDHSDDDVEDAVEASDDASTPPITSLLPPRRCARDSRCTKHFKHLGRCLIPRPLKSTKASTCGNMNGKAIIVCNTLRKAPPKLSVGTPLAAEQLTPPMSATSTSTSSTSTSTSNTTMPIKKRAVPSASWRQSKRPKSEPEMPEMPQLPEPPTLVKSQPWTTRVEHTFENVDAVDAAKARAHARLQAGRAPRNVDYKR